MWLFQSFKLLSTEQARLGRDTISGNFTLTNELDSGFGFLFSLSILIELDSSLELSVVNKEHFIESPVLELLTSIVLML